MTQAAGGGEAFWQCRTTWRQSAHNTKWCLIGCASGDFGTILFFQIAGIPWPALWIFSLAMINGLIASVLLETAILMRGGFGIRAAVKTAMGMSFISMLAMETAMNGVDWLLVGGAMLTWWAAPIALAAGFATPWPYNYWRLKKFGKACH